MIKGSQPRILIPARLNAQRLPGKPLMDIQGKPMVVRVAEACIQAVGRELVTNRVKQIITQLSNRKIHICRGGGGVLGFNIYLLVLSLL